MKRKLFIPVISIAAVSLGASLAFGLEASNLTTNKTTETTITLPEPVKLDMEPKFFYESKGKTDPMDLPWAGKSNKGDGQAVSGEQAPEVEVDPMTVIKPEVKGVVYCQEKPASSLVILGENILKVGQTATIKGLPKTVKVVSIQPNMVTVSYLTKNYKIKIVNESYF